MNRRYFHNAKTNEILEYEIDNNGDCPGGVIKGHLYAYGDAITTGFETKQEAAKWAMEWGYCPKCKSARNIKSKNGKCNFCGNKIIIKEVHNAENRD